MADLPVNLYTLLGIVEVLLVTIALAAVQFFQLRGARRRVAQMQEQLSRSETEAQRQSPPPVPPPAPVEEIPPERDYADFLRDELARSDMLLGEDTQAQAEGALDATATDAEASLMRQMLAARHQFLQLELDVHATAATASPEAQRRSIAMGMQALLDGLRQTRSETPDADDAAAAETPEGDEDPPLLRSEVKRLEDQIAHLRTVIDNQHSVMRELRRLLEEHGNDSEELQEALRKLGDAEAQAVELQRCLEVMEHENQRLKSTGDSGISASPDADMLRDLVGSQQRTISKLQHMLQSLAPDSDKAQELGDAIGKIQRANSELNSCVMVLEDENAMLRGQVETLQERLADLEAQSSPQRGHREQPQPVDAAEDIDAILDGAMSPDTRDAAGVAEAVPAASSDASEAQMDTDELLAELFGGKREGDAAR